VSAVISAGEALTVRVFNPWPAETLARLPGRRGRVVDLQGRPLHPFSEELRLGPFQIATLRLDR